MKLFLSYPRTANKKAEQLKKLLENGGHVVWKDTEQIRVGDDWEKQLEEGIKTSDGIVLALTPDWLKSYYCRWEFATAAEERKHIIPVLLETTPLHEHAVGKYQYADFTNAKIFKNRDKTRDFLDDVKRLSNLGLTISPSEIDDISKEELKKKINLRKTIIRAAIGLTYIIAIPLLLIAFGQRTFIVTTVAEFYDSLCYQRECVYDETVIPVVYDLIEQQVSFLAYCPGNLESSEWLEFRTRLNKLNFRYVTSPYREDLANYRNQFVDTLEISSTYATDQECGVVLGDLLLALRPVLVDYQIDVARVEADTHHQPMIRAMEFYLDTLEGQFHVELGFESERLERTTPEAELFTKYTLIWMVMFFDAERTPTALRAQTSLLAIDSSDAQRTDLADAFTSLHQELHKLSEAISLSDEAGIDRYSSTTMLMISDLAKDAITEDEARFLGGEKLVEVVNALMTVADTGNLSDLAAIRQIVAALQSIRPAGD
jgi:hypothetical protein